MSAKIIKLSNYLGRPKKKRGRPIHEPNKYCLWVEVTIDEEGDEVVEYKLSDDILLDTKFGRELLSRHIGSVLLDLTTDNPELICELMEMLEKE